MCVNGDVRLAYSGQPGVGRVELCLGEEWTNICSGREWTDVHARVICRQLGYQNLSSTSLENLLKQELLSTVPLNTL